MTGDRLGAMAEIADILRRIVDQRRSRVDEIVASGLDTSDRGPATSARPAGEEPFVERIRSADGRAVIAEIKMGSPRLGSLVGSVDPERQARIYAENGAVAISVVVEPDFFFGSYELLTRCRQVSGLPVLAKDFVVHPVQLEWARRAGAAAVLLIAALLSQRELFDLADQARQLGLVPLVECHSLADLRQLAGREWEMIGVNNRDLSTFEVDLRHSMELLPRMPEESVKVAESGIRNGADVGQLAVAGFEAFLVGESLLMAEDPASKLRELVASEASA